MIEPNKIIIVINITIPCKYFIIICNRFMFNPP